MLQKETNHKIIHGDSRDMNLLEAKSVELIITSPPYWQLKDYGSEGQIGFNDSYEDYINNLNLVWWECFRVLKDGCRLCINVGDQFARSVYYGRYKVVPIHIEIIRFCETIGFDFMGQIIWQKTCTTNTTGGASIMGSFPYPRNGIVKYDFEYILLFKKQGVTQKPSKEQYESAKMSIKEWNTYFSGHWNFPGAKQNSHIAVFPDELPTRLIKMFSFPEETILDPFAGSGTTAKSARNLSRNSVSYEINSDFIPLLKSNIGENMLFSKFELLKSPTILSAEDINIKIQSLPYKFIDYHKLNKKVDVKKLVYGSKIDKDSSTKREDFFNVREVISPELLKLNNDLLVKLIGIKQDPIKSEKAVSFLIDKLKGKRVFLKYDDVKYDSYNNLLVYLYLDNKTFINAHLLKEKLVYVDDRIPFRYVNKFFDYRNGGD